MAVDGTRPVSGRWFEQLPVGTTVQHVTRRTVTETDNVLFTTMTMNPAPMHLDADYAAPTRVRPSAGQLHVHRWPWLWACPCPSSPWGRSSPSWPWPLSVSRRRFSRATPSGSRPKWWRRADRGPGPGPDWWSSNTARSTSVTRSCARARAHRPDARDPAGQGWQADLEAELAAAAAPRPGPGTVLTLAGQDAGTGPGPAPARSGQLVRGRAAGQRGRRGPARLTGSSPGSARSRAGPVAVIAHDFTVKAGSWGSAELREADPDPGTRRPGPAAGLLPGRLRRGAR